jgi:hypothetical protein
VKTLRQANPSIPFDFEVITRDPLKVPCLGGGFKFQWIRNQIEERLKGGAA